jgi:hypothetical protein
MSASGPFIGVTVYGWGIFEPPIRLAPAVGGQKEE